MPLSAFVMNRSKRRSTMDRIVQIATPWTCRFLSAGLFTTIIGTMVSFVSLGSVAAADQPPLTLKAGTESEAASVPAAKMPMPQPSEIRFKDEVQSNTSAPVGLDGLVFLDTKGQRVPLRKYLGKKNVVLVFTEGFAGGMLCPYCKTQTSRLIANYEKFAELDTEILVVYPGVRDHLDEFIKSATTSEKAEVDSVPFPLVLDEDLSAVGYFNISSNLAHPSTFIIDKRGNVRLAYVGADMSADRPSVNAMLGVLRNANGQ